MANPETLTLAFVSAHPAEAARILERLSASDTAALFERLPARVGSPALMAMLPSAAARIVNALESRSALALLVACGTQAAVTILRQISEPRRGQLIEGLPTTVAMASRMLLHYGDDSVGAWIDPDIIVFPPETTVDEAIARVASGDEPDVELVFSVDRGQRLIGAISVYALLRLSGTTRLADVAQKPRMVLNASATISGVARRRGWQQAAVIPVTDRNAQLIGVLRRGAIERAMARGHRPAAPADGEPVPAIVARGYWGAFSVLADAFVSLLPDPKNIESGEK
ncbi:MAG: hypothetical protein GTO41_09320 [Burkholderiales bacterium]|nr:hypothetical protein [Burkholderiales bacterium]